MRSRRVGRMGRTPPPPLRSAAAPDAAFASYALVCILCDRARGDHRLLRLLRPGDARPCAATPAAIGGRAWLRLARRPGGVGTRRPPERLAAALRLERGGTGGRRRRRVPVLRPRAGRCAGAAGRRSGGRPLGRAPPARRGAVPALVRLR